MARFKFRLATLLRLREETRDQRRTELAEAYRVDDVLKQRIEHADRELVGLRAHCRQAAGPGALDIDQLVAAQRYELVIRAQRKELIGQREQVTNEIERRRRLLVEANRDVRVLEKLREKQAKRHRQEEYRREIKYLDELAGRTIVREDVS